MNAREVLNFLDDWFTAEENSTETNKLWNVLSALRGPDSGEVNKAYSTCVIRTAAFPKLAVKEMAARRSGCSYVRVYFEQGTEIRVSTDPKHSHFRAHCIDAAAALGLKVAPMLEPIA